MLEAGWRSAGSLRYPHFPQLTAYTDEVEKAVCLRGHDTLLGKDSAISHLEERSTAGKSTSADSKIPDVSIAVVQMSVVSGAGRPKANAIRTCPSKVHTLHERHEPANVFTARVLRHPARVLVRGDSNSRDVRQRGEIGLPHASGAEE